MKIWICGAQGMLGSHFKRLLTKNDIDFLATGKEIDITHFSQVESFITANPITHIINCAAYTQVDLAEKESTLAEAVNALGPYHLGLAAKSRNIKVIHFSTDYVFDGRATQPYEENHLCNPLSVYGQTKRLGEIRLQEACPESLIIRTSWLYGCPGKNFVNTMLKLMLEKETLKVVNDQIGRPTYCEDLAEASLKLLTKQGIYHFANANQTSWYEFACQIKKIGLELDLPFKVNQMIPISTEEYPTPAIRPRYSVFHTKKIEMSLDFIPRSWQEALQDYMMQYVPTLIVKKRNA